jgi:hypothetical protein
MTLSITPLPTASISYSDTVYCESDSNTYPVTLVQTDGTAGTYSYITNTGGPTLSLNTTTGTISPSASDVGTYTITYTIPALAGCAAVTATYDMEIEYEPDATFSYSAVAYCSNDTDPTPSMVENGGTFTSSPSTGALNASTGIIDLSTITPGTYTIYYTFPAVSGGCAQVQESQSVTVSEYVAGGTIVGYAVDDFGVAGPTSAAIVACHDGNGELTLDIGGADTSYIMEWQYASDNGAWTTVPGTNAGSLTYDFVGLTGLTAYRAVIDTGSGCDLVYSEVALVSVIPPTLKPEPVSASPTEFCLNDSSIFSSSTNYGGEVLTREGGFDYGQLNTTDPDGWLVDGELGKLSASANSETPNNWSVNNSDKTFNGITFDNDDPGPPFINHHKYAIANGYYNTTGVGGHPILYNSSGQRITTMETPVFNLMAIDNATFDFREAFSLTGPQAACYTDETETTTEPAPAAEAIIEISLDGGVTYTEFLRPTIVGPASTPANYEDFRDVSIDLSDYFGQTNLRIRFTMVRNCTSTWAIDGISLPGGTPASTVQWTDQFGVIISNENTATVTPITPGFQTYTVTTFIDGCRSLAPDGSEDVDLTVHFNYAGPDRISPSCGASMALHAYDNTKTALENYDEMVADGTWVPGLYALPANPSEDYPGTGATGTWSISSGPSGLGINWGTEDPANYFTDINDPQAVFTGPGGDYVLQWNIAQACPDTVSITLSDCSNLDFDGEDDNVTLSDNFDFNGGPFTLEVWVKPDSQTNSGGSNDAIQTIFSKRDETDMTTGYDLRIQNNYVTFNWNNGNTLSSSPYTIGTDRWYHIAVTFSGGTYTLYVDGLEIANSGGGDTAPALNNFDCVLGAMDQPKGGGIIDPIHYFSGWMDELRIWNLALSIEQIRHMMNQEIQDNGGSVRGTVVPIDIPGLSWTDLAAYYQMDQSTEVAGGFLVATKGTRNGRLRNITSWQAETTPLPYTSIRNGNWNVTTAATPWTYGDTVWDHPNSTGINGADIDWNIVVSNHNITSDTQDVTLLGLRVQSNELTITNTGVQDETNTGTGLWVTHYLYLDGIIDLVGESQLVQKRYTPSQVNGSILDVSSGGYIERDQQGTTNLYNYNYWSSPASTINTISNNTPYNIDYALGGVLRDGTISSNPLNIAWVTGHDASGTTNPIGTSSRWIYAYENYPENTYAAWRYLSNTGTLASGLGFTMKGSGVGDPVNDVQNYVFTGKPNNGSISTPITVGYNALVGNPYPSAIDANEFITDNSSSIGGTLYFWIHYTSNFTHILEDYEGGYATYNLTGGNAAVTPPTTVDGQDISGLGSSSLIPGQYIPVAQGFFVNASASGGNVMFENDQRIFERETTTNSIFLRTGDSPYPSDHDAGGREDSIKRVRIRFMSPDGSHRPLLLGFDPKNRATDGIDYGFDGIHSDEFIPNDMAWIIDDQQYVIQGVGRFNNNKRFPLGIFLTTEGDIKIGLEALENFEKEIDVFIHDALLDTYTRINDDPFKMSLDIDDYIDRFWLTFKSEEKEEEDEEDEEEVTADPSINVLENTIVSFLSKTNEIYIHVPDDVNVKQVYLINILGQSVNSWNVFNTNFSTETKIPVKNITDGTYIIKVETDASTINKKVIVQH